MIRKLGVGLEGSDFLHAIQIYYLYACDKSVWFIRIFKVPTYIFQGEGDAKKGAFTEHKHETEEILNTILPPKEWDEDGQLWRQQVSTTPATRLDVINLQEQLDMRLQQRQVIANPTLLFIVDGIFVC